MALEYAAPLEYAVVQCQIVGTLDDYQYSYSSDRVRSATRAAAIRRGMRELGHDDWLLAILARDTLVAVAWMDEDRKYSAGDAEGNAGERAEMAEQNGWKVLATEGATT